MVERIGILCAPILSCAGGKPVMKTQGGRIRGSVSGTDSVFVSPARLLSREQTHLPPTPSLLFLPF